MIHRILFASPKGGCGKSNLTRNMAVAAVHDNVRVATADLDPQATLTIWSRRRKDGLRAIPHYRVGWEDANALLDDGELPTHQAILIDTPPSIETQPAAFATLLAASALVIVPCRPTFDDAESAGPFLKYLRAEGRRAVVVLNFVKPRVNTNAVKSYLLNVAEICPIEIADRTDYGRAGAKGMGLIDIPGHAGAEEVQGVWTFVKSKVWRRSYGKAQA
jgi:chromosome partitioning protein